MTVLFTVTYNSYCWAEEWSSHMSYLSQRLLKKHYPWFAIPKVPSPFVNLFGMCSNLFGTHLPNESTSLDQDTNILLFMLVFPLAHHTRQIRERACCLAGWSMHFPLQSTLGASFFSLLGRSQSSHGSTMVCPLQSAEIAPFPLVEF